MRNQKTYYCWGGVVPAVPDESRLENTPDDFSSGISYSVQ